MDKFVALCQQIFEAMNSKVWRGFQDPEGFFSDEALVPDCLLAVLRVELQEMPYKDYLRTRHWEEKRDAALDKSRRACQLCNASGVILDVRHRTYERRGREFPEDLIVLCRGCHAKFHNKEP